MYLESLSPNILLVLSKYLYHPFSFSLLHLLNDNFTVFAAEVLNKVMDY